jgi:hypothetical protein
VDPSTPASDPTATALPGDTQPGPDSSNPAVDQSSAGSPAPVTPDQVSVPDPQSAPAGQPAADAAPVDAGTAAGVSTSTDNSTAAPDTATYSGLGGNAS